MTRRANRGTVRTTATCSGSVRFVREGISAATYRALSTALIPQERRLPTACYSSP